MGIDRTTSASGIIFVITRGVPLIDFDMRLGESAGVAITIRMADEACKIMCQMASLDEVKVAE